MTVETIKLPPGSSNYCVVAGGQVEIPLALVALSGKLSDLSTGSANGIQQPLRVPLTQAISGGNIVNSTGGSGLFSLQAAGDGTLPYLQSEVANNGTITDTAEFYVRLPDTYVAGAGFSVTANGGVFVASGTLGATHNLKADVYVLNDGGTANTAAVAVNIANTLSTMGTIPGPGTDMTFAITNTLAAGASLVAGQLLQIQLKATVVNTAVGTIEAAINSVRLS